MERGVNLSDPSYSAYALMPGQPEDLQSFPAIFPCPLYHSHESSCGDNVVKNVDLSPLKSWSFFPPVEPSIAPSALQASHKSHDDSCVDQCPGSYNSQGLPRFPPPPPSRPRLTPTSCPLQSLQPALHQQQWDSLISTRARSSNNHDNHDEGFVLPSFTNSTRFAMLQREICIKHVQLCQRTNASRDESGSCSQECCASPDREENLWQSEVCLNSGYRFNNTTYLTNPAHIQDCFRNIEPFYNFRDFRYSNASSSNKWITPESPSYGSVHHDSNCSHVQTDNISTSTLEHVRHDFVPISSPDIIYHGDADPTSAANALSLTAQTATVSPISHQASISLPDAHRFITCRWLVQDVHKDICGQVFDSTKELQTHVHSEHVTKSSDKLCCWESCTREKDKAFMSRNKLQRHVATHTAYKPFTCEYCLEAFSAQQALDQHRRIHTGEKPFQCDFSGCTKAFKQKSALTMHKRTHTGEKPLACDVCGKLFGESSNLSKHRRTHFPEYKYQCAECPRSFIRVDQLRRHQRKHERKRQETKNEVCQVFDLSIAEGGMPVGTLQQYEVNSYNMLQDFQ